MLELVVGGVVRGCWFGVDMLGVGTLFRFCERGLGYEELGDVPWTWASSVVSRAWRCARASGENEEEG